MITPAALGATFAIGVVAGFCANRLLAERPGERLLSPWLPALLAAVAFLVAIWLPR